MELKEIKLVLDRIQEGWHRALISNDDYYVDSVALNLHGFYSGLERIFSLISETIDGNLPGGENWHILLLKLMTEEIPGIRPAVISENSAVGLNEYRGFRHVVRNVYSYRFDPEKVEKLVINAPFIYLQLEKEITAFSDFLDS